ncbi:MAG TPA: hypothetical protein VFX22_11210 [Candidatus Kapabacteria bacterium]|nr:hypothetical protein [Candidatus Kapabacteria bacterium]
MKTAVSIWCAAVTTLLTMRATAQVDSNSVLRLYCGPITAGCEIDVVCQDGRGSIVSTSTTDGFDSSIRFADIAGWGASSYPWQELNFRIDSVDSEIVGLTIAKREDVRGNSEYGGDITGFAGLSLTFPLIPFHYINNVVQIPQGQFLCYIYAYGFAQYGMYNPCSGSCKTYDTIMDSVFFEITPARDLVEYPLEKSKYFRAISMSGQEAISYSPQPFDRTLEVLDILGRTVSIAHILSGQSLTDLALPPGCYFTRLGNEVAKFVVPPR